MNDLVDRSGIDLKALRALVAVADHGSFRSAAKSLGYTQSAISHQIAMLEGALDAPLFTRPGGRGAVTMTVAGDVAYRRARRVLGEVETLGADVAAIEHGQRRPLRIGVFQTATTELLPGALRTLREQRPDVEVVLTEIQDNTRTFDRLAAGELDLAFLVNPVPDERVRVDPVARRSVGDPDPARQRAGIVTEADLRPARRRRPRRVEPALAHPAGARAGVAPTWINPGWCTGPMTTWRSSGWSPPATDMPAWTGWEPPVRWSRR